MFGQILSDLAFIGVLEKFNTFTYKKTINWLQRLEIFERGNKENTMYYSKKNIKV